MNDADFKALGKEMLKQMRQISTIHDACNLFSELEKLKRYIFDHPNSECVKKFRDDLIDEYCSFFFKKELFDALNLSDQFPYYKQLVIYANLPYTSHPLYPYYLPKILVTPSELFADFYGTFLWVLEQYRPDLAASPHLQAITEFVNQNKNVIHGSVDHYDSLEKEIEFYNKAIRGSEFKELDEFAWSQQLMDREIIFRQFINKKVGNIGEIYTYQAIKELFSPCFVSRDIKNGFGYDIFYFDNNGIENLVEVKTTMGNGIDDFFSMSENEYTVMKNCFNSPHSKYCICRVHLDPTLNPSFTLLTMRDDDTLVSADGIEYKLYRPSQREIYFRKQVQKKMS